MNASEARAVAHTFDEALIEKTINVLMEKVKRAAEQNELHITFTGWISPRIRPQYGEALENELIKRIKAKGFEFEKCPAEGDGPYMRISWRGLEC